MTIEYPIKCLECGNIYNKQITNSHLKKHNMATADYIEKHGEGSLTSESYRNERSLAMAGENNPNYGNTMSEESKQKISNANRNREGFWKGNSFNFPNK